MSKKFNRPHGHCCLASSHPGEGLTFGTGELDQNGFWELGCYECAREHERQFPEDGECWPFSTETLKTLNKYQPKE